MLNSEVKGQFSDIERKIMKYFLRFIMVFIIFNAFDRGRKTNLIDVLVQEKIQNSIKLFKFQNL